MHRWDKNYRYRRRAVGASLRWIGADLRSSKPLGERRHGVSVPNLRYTIRTVNIENRMLTIDREQYRFGRELGSGAFGSVYAAQRASDSNLKVSCVSHLSSSFSSDRPVAVKVVSLASLSSALSNVLAQSILNEIEMSKRLSKASNHVVHMYSFDFHRHTGLAFLVMELGEKDLEKALRDKGRLSSGERKYVWRQLVSIAVTLHDNDIVGRASSLLGAHR